MTDIKLAADLDGRPTHLDMQLYDPGDLPREFHAEIERWIDETLRAGLRVGQSGITIDDNSAVILVAERIAPRHTHNLVGCVAFHGTEQVGLVYANFVYVRPAWRKRGIAVAMLQELGRVARLNGCPRVSLITRTDNASMLAAARRARLEPCGIYLESAAP
jgi:GNAT superfamily N-acetyltransferase